jgi:hypothetical protein
MLAALAVPALAMPIAVDGSGADQGNVVKAQIATGPFVPACQRFASPAARARCVQIALLGGYVYPEYRPYGYGPYVEPPYRYAPYPGWGYDEY